MAMAEKRAAFQVIRILSVGGFSRRKSGARSASQQLAIDPAHITTAGENAPNPRPVITESSEIKKPAALPLSAPAASTRQINFDKGNLAHGLLCESPFHHSMAAFTRYGR